MDAIGLGEIWSNLVAISWELFELRFIGFDSVVLLLFLGISVKATPLLKYKSSPHLIKSFLKIIISINLPINILLTLLLVIVRFPFPLTLLFSLPLELLE